MTISPTAPLRSATYVGDGVTTSFAFPFFVLTPEEVSVYVDNVLQETGYSVSPIPPGGLYGGSVNFTAAPETGAAIDIVDAPIISQERDYTNQAGVYPDDVERALDKLTRMIRRLSYDMIRAVKAPVGTARERTIRPGPAGTAPVWNSSGDLIPGPTTADFEGAREDAEAVMQARADIDALLGGSTYIDMEEEYRDAVQTGGGTPTPGA